MASGVDQTTCQRTPLPFTFFFFFFLLFSGEPFPEQCVVTSGSRRRPSYPSRETLFLMVPADVSGLDWVPCLSLSTNRETMSPPATGHMPGTAPDTLYV